MSNDDENLQFVRKDLEDSRGGSRIVGVVLPLVAALIAWWARGSVKSAGDAALLGVFLLALVVPGIFALRKSFRSVDNHPLWLALTAHRDWIEKVELTYTKNAQSGRVTHASVTVRLGSHGMGFLYFNRPDGKEREIASWIQSRKLDKSA